MTVSFLKGLTTIRDDSTMKKNYALLKSIDQIAFARNLNYISPLYFPEALIKYSITGSRLSTALAGATSPAGGYTSLLKWLNRQGSNQPVSPPGEVVLAFDNNQVISKTYKVRANNKVEVNTITTVIQIQVDDSCNIQANPSVSPLVWRGKSLEGLSLYMQALEMKAEELHEDFLSHI